MGMTGNYRHVSERVLAALLADPSLVTHVLRYVRGDDDGLPPEVHAMAAALAPERANQLLTMMRAQLAAQGIDRVLAGWRAAARSALEAAGLSEDELGDTLPIDKAWHGLHLVLAGSDHAQVAPPGNVVLGGTEIGEDRGYGPARYLRPDEVRAAAAALGAMSDDDFRRRYDPGALKAARAYAMRPDDPEEREWLTEAFRRVRDYFARAAERNHAMMLYLA